MLMSHAALPHLRESKGNIVTIASIAGLRAQPYQAAYCASKSGVIMLMKSLALELAADGIRVNTICPGGIQTDLPTNAAAEHADSPHTRLGAAHGDRRRTVRIHAAQRHLRRHRLLGLRRSSLSHWGGLVSRPRNRLLS